MNMPDGAESGEMAGMPAMAKQPMKMGVDKPDLNDVKYDAFLANPRTLADPEVVRVEPGGAVLLRVIKARR